MIHVVAARRRSPTERHCHPMTIFFNPQKKQRVGAPMPTHAGSRRVALSVFRKPSQIPPMQESDFRGFPQARFDVLKIPGFRTGGPFPYCNRRGKTMTKTRGRIVSKRVAIYL